MNRTLAVLILGCSLAVTAAAINRDDTDRRTIHDRESSRALALERMRIAAADRLIERDDELRAYKAAGFNTIVLYDAEDGLLKSEERIAFETKFARANGLRIVLGKGTEPLTNETSASVISNAVRRRHALGTASVGEVSDEEIQQRLGLWKRYADDLVIAVFFLHDDAFYIRTSVERQRHLYQLAHETVPDWYVLGMIGEGGFNATETEVATYFDPSAFDHLLLIMYPLNVGASTGMPIDNISSADPDADMRLYVRRYLTVMGEKFIRRLAPGQLTVLVVQAFAYYGEPEGHIPRAADISIEATVGSQCLREVPGQERNRSMAYFLWDGSHGGTMFGLWQRNDWMSAAEQANDIDPPNGAVERILPREQP